MVDTSLPLPEFLRRMAIFTGLSPGQVEALASEFEVFELEPGEVLFVEGAKPDNFYVLYSGQLEVWRGDEKHKQLIGTFVPGDHVGEEGLLAGVRRAATVAAVEPSLVLRLNQGQFNRLILLYPKIRMFLLATLESRRLASRQKIGWVAPGETIYLLVCKHVAYLIFLLVGPVILGLMGVGALAMAVTATSITMETVLAWVASALFVLSVAWGVWSWIDWGNDYYIVTNQRVIWLEKVIGLYDSRQEAPLSTILTVAIQRDLLGRLFGYGNVLVRTFTGQILMRSVGLPEQLAGLIEEQIARGKAAANKQETVALERTIQRRLGITPPLQPPPAVTTNFQRDRRIKNPPFVDWLGGLFKVRYEKGNVVTFRKHWIMLLKGVWIPTLLFLFVVGLIVARQFDYLTFFSKTFLLLVGSAAMIGLLAWWIYEYVDWVNDIYQVTPELIVDIYRKPLGQEDKKTAPLENILSLEHERIGLIGLLLNYGNVIAMVGAVKFTFDGVYDPPGVQQEVFQHITARKLAIREAEAARERERIADWVAVYHQQVEGLRRSQKPPDTL